MMKSHYEKRKDNIAHIGLSTEKIFIKKAVHLLLYVLFILSTFLIFFNFDVPGNIYGDYLFNNGKYQKSAEIFDFLSVYKPEKDIYRLKALRAYQYLPFTYSVQNKFLNAALKDDSSKEEQFATEIINNFRQTVFKSYGNNYTRECLYNGIVMRWDKNSFPLTYSVSTEHPMPRYYSEASDKAFKEWENGTNGFIKFKRVLSNADISVVFSENSIEKKLDKNMEYKAAITMPVIEQDKFLKHMKIKVLIRDYFGKIIEPEEIKIILAHEIGHALGLWGHTKDINAIMYYSRKKPYSYYSDKTVSSLNAKDINTIKLLYALSPDVSNTVEALTDKEKGISARALFEPLDENFKKFQISEDYEILSEDPADTVNYAVELTNSKQYEKSNSVLFSIFGYITDKQIRGKILSLSAFNYAKTGELQKALRNAKLAVLQNENSENYGTLAYIYYLDKEYKSAEKYYKTAISKDKTDTNAYYGLADTYIKEYSFLRARNTLQSLKRNNPDSKFDKRFKRYFFLLP